MAEGKGIPDSVAPVIAHLVVSNGAEAIAFYTNAFGAESFGVHYTPDGKLMHAELKIGDARLMLADEFPSVGCASPKTLGGTTVVLNLYSEDVDTLFDRAVRAGAMVTMPLANQFWGDRYGQITDPLRTPLGAGTARGRRRSRRDGAARQGGLCADGQGRSSAPEVAAQQLHNRAARSGSRT